jgi:hypothetical protein
LVREGVELLKQAFGMIQHSVCRPTLNWPVSSLTITVPGRKPWDLI